MDESGFELTLDLVAVRRAILEGSSIKQPTKRSPP